MKCGVWRVQCEVWGVKSAVWSVECEVWSVECDVWSVECAVGSVQWSVKCGLGRVQCEVRSVECEVWSVQCGVWRVQWEVWRAKWSFKCDMWNRTPLSQSARTHGLGWRTAHASSIDEKSLIYIFKATSAPPRAGTTGIIDWIRKKTPGRSIWLLAAMMIMMYYWMFWEPCANAMLVVCLVSQPFRQRARSR